MVGGGSAARSYTGLLGPAAPNAEVLFSGSLSAFGGNNLGAVLRWGDSKDYYKAYLSGTNLVIIKKVNGAITRLASIAFAATVGASSTLLFSASGGTLAASAWPGGGSQPPTWMVSASDGSLSAGRCGVLAYLASGASAHVTAFQATSQ